ncbi:MAG: TonB-dependent receptor, partial [Gemmatimonadota bacterium]
RVDGNSAFGQDLGLQAYPKVSASWVVSDEDFWNDSYGQLKLRAAWGQSGRAPGAFDAVRTYDPVGWGGDPAFFTRNVGNSELGPERTAELEFGFDASFWDNRLSIEYTHYNQHTTDALFNVRQVPSLGFLGSQLENVGELKNRGHELGFNVAAIQGESFGWDIGGSVYTNDSEVAVLPSEVPSFSLGGFGWVVEGQPIPVIQARCVTNRGQAADPIIDNECNFGPNQPTLTINGNTSFSLPAGMSLTMRGEYQGGHYIANGAAGAAISRSVRWPGCFEAYRIDETQGRAAVPAELKALCFGAPFRDDYTIDKADFFKIREVTLSMPVPERLLVAGASSATLTFSGRNLWRWVNSEWGTLDPEMGNNGGFDEQVRSLLEHIPAPAVYTMSLRLSF